MSPARQQFRLEDLGDGLATVTWDAPDRKVNVFDREVLGELERLVEEIAGAEGIRCLVLLSGKPGQFIAGADVEQIATVADTVEAEAASRLGQRVFAAWEALPFPTVAAVNGTCVGGGTELALACDYLLLSDRADLRIGLPEVRLGILPAWGGCTRLPRRIGIAAALDIILAGKTLPARKAFRVGLADALMPAASFPHLVHGFARAVIAGPPPERSNGGGLRRALLEGNPVGRRLLFDQARKKVLETTAGNYPAPLRALEVVRTGVEKGAAAGFDAEAREAAELAVSPVCKNLMHVFRLLENAKKTPAEEAPLRRAAVLGAGVMGGGIAQLLAYEAAVPVRLKDIAPAPLETGMAHAAELFSKLVERRRLSEPEAAARMALLRPTLDYSGFADADLVVEAVVERIEVKQAVFRELSAAVGSSTILASNTSSLSIGAIAEAATGPERVVGMHFFNPVHKMPLVEVIAGPETSPKVVAKVVGLCLRLGKTPVVVRDSPGFLVNRLLTFTLAETLALLAEGVAIEPLDRIMKAWGMPMGPVTLTDEVGIDVAVHVAHILEEAYPDRLRFPAWIDRMVEDGRLGAKTGRGFYTYEGGKRLAPDRDAYRLLGLEPRIQSPDAAEIADRSILPMLNEAARCLAEGVVADAASLDLALILGTGFPPFRGGLCRWADGQGAAALADSMRRLEQKLGERFTPSAAFEEVVAAGGFYARFPRSP